MLLRKKIKRRRKLKDSTQKPITGTTVLKTINHNATTTDKKKLKIKTSNFDDQEKPKRYRCDICLEFARLSIANMFKCSNCNCEIHKACLESESISNLNNEFVCKRCEHSQKGKVDFKKYKYFYY